MNQILETNNFCDTLYSKHPQLVKNISTSLNIDNCKSIPLLSNGIMIFTYEMVHSLFNSYNMFNDIKGASVKSKKEFFDSPKLHFYFVAIASFLRINNNFWKRSILNSFSWLTSYGMIILFTIFVIYILHMIIVISILGKKVLAKFNLYLEKIRVIISINPQTEILDKDEISYVLNNYL